MRLGWGRAAITVCHCGTSGSVGSVDGDDRTNQRDVWNKKIYHQDPLHLWSRYMNILWTYMNINILWTYNPFYRYTLKISQPSRGKCRVRPAEGGYGYNAIFLSRTGSPFPRSMVACTVSFFRLAMLEFIGFSNTTWLTIFFSFTLSIVPFFWLKQQWGASPWTRLETGLGYSLQLGEII